MPNGDHTPKNWSRLQVLLAAFNERFGCWPDEIHAGVATWTEFYNYLGHERYATLIRKVRPHANAYDPYAVLVASTSDGARILSYSDADVRDGREVARAAAWLRISDD